MTSGTWHGLKKCAVNGAKIPKGNRVIGQPCPFCGNLLGAQISSSTPDAHEPKVAVGAAATVSDGKPFYKRWWFIALAVLGVLIVFAALSDAGEQDDGPGEAGAPAELTTTTEAPTTTEAEPTTIVESPTTTAEAPTTTDQVAIPGTLGMTPDEFRDAWNTVVDESDSPTLLLPPLTIEEGAVQDVISELITDRIVLTIAVNKADGSVRDMSLITEPSDDLFENTEALLAWAALFRASTVPPSDPEHAGAVFGELGILESDLIDLEADAVVAGVRYTALFTPELGFFFLTAGDPTDTG